MDSRSRIRVDGRSVFSDVQHVVLFCARIYNLCDGAVSSGESVKRPKLFIPGPVEVSDEVLARMATPPVWHRSEEFSRLYSGIVEKLKRVLYTKGDVFVATSSSTGVMEAAIRNCVKDRVLCFVNGAFSERWAKIARLCGKRVEVFEVEWGRAIKPEHVADALRRIRPDAVCLVHNETSTGVMSPLYEIADVLKDYPDVCFLVDAVSSQAAVKIEVDRLGIDVCLAGVQKGYALPPGIAVFSVSEKALAKAKEVDGKGFYFNFELFHERAKDGQTPTTPSVPHLFALDFQLDRILSEGLDERFERHMRLAERCRRWALERGFTLFPEPGYESITLTTINNTLNIDFASLDAFLKRRGFVISGGYGKLEGHTFRIGHMGDCTTADLDELLVAFDDYLAQANLL